MDSSVLLQHEGLQGLAWVLLLAWLVYAAWRRLQLSLAKQPGLVGHVKMAKWLARRLPAYSLSPSNWHLADQPTQEVANLRKMGFERLAQRFTVQHADTLAKLHTLKQHLSDSRFIGLYRVPFPFRHIIQQAFTFNPFFTHSHGHTLIDTEGHHWMDLTGSYGTNLLGHEAYKSFMRQALDDTLPLGPLLGHYHPVVANNVHRLCQLSGMDEVSFHMSGTEAVMQAVRLAQYHTGRKRIVRFAGAYHGWWGEVQPGVGNPVNAQHTLTLKECSARSLRIIGQRRDIACVLVNPLQALHPNANAPADSALLAGKRKAQFNKAEYSQWLQQLQHTCNQAGVVLIVDEVFLGFRLGLGGAQQYFGVQADLVTYGKTLGGGLPVGVVCGKAQYMARYKPHRPADVCFARGTFNAHPTVQAAMNHFLRHLDAHPLPTGPELDTLWNTRAQQLNSRLTALNLPVRVANLTSVWTLVYPMPSRYHWMLQFYLREMGLLLSWVGTGRLIFSHDYTDEAFDAFAQRFVQAALNMQADGWWTPGAKARSPFAMRLQLIQEMLSHWLGRRTLKA